MISSAQMSLSILTPRRETTEDVFADCNRNLPSRCTTSVQRNFMWSSKCSRRILCPKDVIPSSNLHLFHWENPMLQNFSQPQTRLCEKRLWRHVDVRRDRNYLVSAVIVIFPANCITRLKWILATISLYSAKIFSPTPWNAVKTSHVNSLDAPGDSPSCPSIPVIVFVNYNTKT